MIISSSTHGSNTRPIKAQTAGNAYCLTKDCNAERAGVGAMPSGLPRQRSRCGVANPRRAMSTSVVCALHRLHCRGNVPYEMIMNRL